MFEFFWRITAIMAGVGLWLACQFAIQEFFRHRINKRRDEFLARGVLQGLLEGTDESTMYMKTGFAFMTNTYHQYISSLPDHKKAEILDKLLAHAEKRANSTELLQILGCMHSAEVQTLCSILYEKVTINARVGDLADRLFVFRITHPPDSYLGR